MVASLSAKVIVQCYRAIKYMFFPQRQLDFNTGISAVGCFVSEIFLFTSAYAPKSLS